MSDARGVALACGMVMGCGDGSWFPDVSWSSEDFEFATDLDVAVCGGTFAYQQRFVDLAQDVFGEPVDGRKFVYYLLSQPKFEELLGEREGAYVDAQVFARTLVDFHEVTHAVVDLSIGMSHPFFNEGIAEVFRDRYSVNRVPIGRVDDALEIPGSDGKIRGSLYGRAGHFMAYALDVHGVAATVELLASARMGESAEALQADIAGAFGMSYADVLADYADYPGCDHDEFRWPITECDVGPTIAAVDGVWSFDMEADCDGDTVIGPRNSELWAVHTFEVPEDGTYLASVAHDDGDIAYVVTDHCSPGCGPDKGQALSSGKSRELSLRRGRHQITSVAIRVQSGHVRTRIERVPDAGL